MPTLLVVEGFRFFFFSNDRNEPAHVHLERGDGYATLWLEPVKLAYSTGLKAQELRRARELVEQHADAFMESWNEHFG